MSESFEAVEHRGRRYGTAIPNWRIQDEALTPHQFRIACYLSSHDPSFLERKVTRNFIASQLSMNVTTVSTSIDALEALGIVAREEREIPLAEGGKRWVLVFDHEVWETDPTLERFRSKSTATGSAETALDDFQRRVEAASRTNPTLRSISAVSYECVRS